VLETTERLAQSGRDVTQFARDLLAHLRQLIVIRTVGEAPDSFTVTAAEPERLQAQAAAASDLALARAVDVISKALADIREGDEPRMTVELALLRAARPQLDPSREALAERLERLEAAVSGVARGPVAAAPREAAPVDSPESTPAPQTSEEGDSRDSRELREASSEEPAAPDPGGSPVAQAAAAAAVVDLEKVASLWPAVIDQVRESGSTVLSHALDSARPVALDVEDAVLKVGFPASAAFNKRKAEAAEARQRFTDALRTIVGERLKPVYVLLDPDEEPGGERQLTEDELVELMRSEFDAELVVDDEDDASEAKEA
jgi:DNA polymerase-3 subunit gamma/tau